MTQATTRSHPAKDLSRGHVPLERWGNSAGRIAQATLRWVYGEPLGQAGDPVCDANQVERLLRQAQFSHAEHLAFYGLLAAIGICAAAHSDLDEDLAMGSRAADAQMWLAVHDMQRDVLEECASLALGSLPEMPRVRDILLKTPSALTDALLTLIRQQLREIEPKERVSLRRVGLQDVRHPRDTSRPNEVESGISQMLSWVTTQDKRITQLTAAATGLRVGSDCIPTLWKIYKEVCDLFAIQTRNIPPLYVRSGGLSASVVGVENPIILVDSMAASLFDSHEIAFVLGREIGHIFAEHTYFMTAGAVGQAIREGVVDAGLAQTAIGFLDNWQSTGWRHGAALTADRFGYLACQSREAALRVLMKQSGYPARHYPDINTRAFARQAEEFAQKVQSNQIDHWISQLKGLEQKNGFSIVRAAELLDWIKGDGQNLLDRCARGDQPL